MTLVAKLYLFGHPLDPFLKRIIIGVSLELYRPAEPEEIVEVMDSARSETILLSPKPTQCRANTRVPRRRR